PGEDVAEDERLAGLPGEPAAHDGRHEHVGEVAEYARVGYHSHDYARRLRARRQVSARANLAAACARGSPARGALALARGPRGCRRAPARAAERGLGRREPLPRAP